MEAGKSNRGGTVPLVLLAGVLCAVLLAVPPATCARILPGHGIARVDVGFSATHVRHLLGRPHKVVPPTWVYGAPLKGRVGFNHRYRVNDVWTKSLRQKTPKGIGPGSSLRAMRRAYPHARCHASKRGPRRICTLTARHGRHRINTDFLFKGRLRLVDVYLVPPPLKPGPK
jgi:hypothetical protein